MISFNTASFYLVVLISFVLYNYIVKPKHRKHVLFLINSIFLVLIFYFSKKHFISLSMVILINFFGIKILQTIAKKNLLMLILVIFDVLFLCFFKYNFFQELVLIFLPSGSFLLKPLIFIGISFFSFRLISCVVDSKEDDAIKIDFFHFVSFTTFFPCFLMGPLDRYDHFVSNFELDQQSRLDSKEIYQSLERIIWGAFKKLAIADLLLDFSLISINDVDLPNLPFHKIIFSHYLYYLVLYFDFSGYCDIAIGISKLFGIHTPENFNRPYLAANIQQFWQRWHITLMEWLKDYLFYPILRQFLNINGKYVTTVTSLSIIITFAIAGVWHGDGINFLYHGLFHGAAFSIWYFYRKLLTKILSREQLKKYDNNIFIRGCAIFVTFHYFLASLIYLINKGLVYQIFFKSIL